MKFYSLFLFLAFLGKCSDSNNQSFCSYLEKSSSHAALKSLSANHSKKNMVFSPREFLIRQNEIYDTLKALEIISVSGYTKDTTHSYFRYSDDFRLLEKKQEVNGKNELIYLYEYDDFGNLIRRKGGNDLREWKYDKSQNLIENHSKNYSYYFQNEDLKVTEYTVRNIKDTSEYQFPYNEKVLSRFDEDTMSIRMTLYDEKGLYKYYETTHFFPDGRFKRMTTEIVYDTLNRKSMEIFTNNIGISKTLIPQITKYFYDECGLMKSVVSYFEGIEDTRDTMNYEHKILPSKGGLLKIMTTVDSNYQITRTYDRKGNWIHKISFRQGEFTNETSRIIHYKDNSP